MGNAISGEENTSTIDSPAISTVDSYPSMISENMSIPEKSTHRIANSVDSNASSPSSLTDRVLRMVNPRVEDELAIKKENPYLQVAKGENVPTAFKWSSGGKRVFVTGSFNNWQGKIMMHPNDDNPNEFVLIIDISPGTHQYKFIVDGEWRLNPNAPTIVDHGVVNNVVTVKRPVFEMNLGRDVPFDDSDEEIDNSQVKSGYGQVLPLSEEYSTLPPKMPPHLLSDHLCLNAPIDTDDPYVLPTPSHVTLNHFFISETHNEVANKRLVTRTDEPTKEVKRNANCELDDNVLVTALTQRFQTKPHISVIPKFVTLIYYRPKPHSKSSTTKASKDS